MIARSKIKNKSNVIVEKSVNTSTVIEHDYRQTTICMQMQYSEKKPRNHLVKILKQKYETMIN